MISAASVRDIFTASGIEHVAIIDDDFDPPGTNLSPSDRQTLFEQLTSNPRVRAALTGASIALDEPDDLKPPLIKEIENLAGEGNAGAQEAWEAIAIAAQNRRAALDRLAERLSDDLKVSVKTISALTAQEPGDVVPTKSNVIFLDYELKVGDVAERLSSVLAKRIYEQFMESDAVPLVILMSNHDLTDDDVAKFRKGTDLLSGMFYFVAKEDLFEQEKLHYRLAAFAKALPTGQILQRFVHRIEASLDAVRKTVFSDVRSLSIADYAFLQTMGLSDDGQPMGEYLMWLIGAHLVRELGVRQDVRDIEARVNALSFEYLPPTQASPSSSLSALYSSAVMRPADKLPAEPTDPATYLQFGDFFRKPSSRQVWVCLTPACDLAFSPTRPIPSKRSMIFLPGTLHPIDKPLKPFEQRQPRTELVRLNDKTYRVVWRTKEVVSAPWADLKAWLATIKAERVARLNTPFAVEVQRSLAADVTRIGMPVPPPFYSPVKVRLTYLEAVAPLPGEAAAKTWDAVLAGGDRGERLVLGGDLMNHLPAMLGVAEEALAAREEILAADQADGTDPAAAVRDAKAKIADARQNASTLSGMRGPFKLAGVGESTVELGGLLAVCNGDVLPAEQASVPLRVHVLPPAQ